MKTKKTRHTAQLITAIVIIAVGCGLLIAGFITPPPGEIHNSILIAFGEILTFGGALLGIDYKYRYSQSERKNDDEDDKESLK